MYNGPENDIWAESSPPKWQQWLQMPEIWIIALSGCCMLFLVAWYGMLFFGQDARDQEKK